MLQTKVSTTKYNDNGYVGSWLCDENGIFSSIPIITISFSRSFPDVIPGLTITWSATYGEWAKKYRVIAYHSNNIIFLETFENDSVFCIANGDIRGYDRIEIEILEWSKPYRRARLERIYLGVEKSYGKPDIMSYSHTMSSNPLSAELPKSEITFELKNLNNEFNPDNPTGIEKYLLERQIITTRYGYLIDEEIEWIDGGLFYLSEWETPQNGITASFTARDVSELMTDIYSGPTEDVSLYEIIESSFEQANIPLLSDGRKPWEIDDSLKYIGIPIGTDFKSYTIAEVIQLASNAGCCTMLYDRVGMMHIMKLGTKISDYRIDRFNSYKNAEIVLSKQLKAVDINQGQYSIVVGTRGETQQLSNDLITDNQAPIVAKWISDFLVNRRQLSGEFRADPRLDPLDIVVNENQFSRSMVLITELQLNYNGAFRGNYEGRTMSNLSGSFYYSGDIFSGEV